MGEPSVAVVVDGRASWRDWIDLTKPRITLMVLLTAGIGVFLAAGGEGLWDHLPALVATWLVAAGSSSLNHALEHERDSRMERTAGRPVPTGRLKPSTASWLGVALGTVGLGWLAWQVNWKTAALGWLAFMVYVAVYTPLKPKSSLATLVGAVPGAIPPMMGWTAVTGRVDTPAWVLFAILFFWQLPHFLAIAWMCRDDYAKAGFPMLPVVQPDGKSTARQMVLYCAALIPVSLAPSLLGLTRGPYFLGALLLGVLFLACCLLFARQFTHGAARRVLLMSVIYLPALFAAMVLDRVA